MYGGELLGKGGFGVVQEIIWLGLRFAKKEFKGGDNKFFRQEIGCSLVMELMDTDLYDFPNPSLPISKHPFRNKKKFSVLTLTLWGDAAASEGSISGKAYSECTYHCENPYGCAAWTYGCANLLPPSDIRAFNLDRPIFRPFFWFPLDFHTLPTFCFLPLLTTHFYQFYTSLPPALMSPAPGLHGLLIACASLAFSDRYRCKQVTSLSSAFWRKIRWLNAFFRFLLWWICVGVEILWTSVAFLPFCIIRFACSSFLITCVLVSWLQVVRVLQIPKEWHCADKDAPRVLS